jgi:hypothetical protein
MRINAVVIYCLLCALTCSLSASVTVVSRRHSVRGSAGYHQINSYEILNSPQPLSGSATGIGFYNDAVTASSSAGGFAVSASITNSIFSGSAEAESTYVFRPLSNVLDFSISGYVGSYPWDGCEVSCHIKNLSTDTYLLQYDSPTDQQYGDPDYDGFSISYTESFSVNTSDEYELFLRALASQGDAGATMSSLTADIGYVPTIPAPEAIVLCGIGAALVSWLRRRRTL